MTAVISKTFSISEERFFLVGEGSSPVWIVIMQGQSATRRANEHVAFKIEAAQYEDYVSRVRSTGIQMLPERPRVNGEDSRFTFTTSTTICSSYIPGRSPV
jgi:hypothetical protein